MVIPNINTVFDDAAIGVVDDILGDTIQYKPKGGVYADLQGYVDYGEAVRDIATGILIDQDISLKIAKALVPARPGGNDRLILPKLPNVEFKPINTQDVGDDWLIAVQRV